MTSFVTDNFDNVLDPGVFFLVTMGNQYPMLSPWIEDIMSKATDHFKNDPYVKDYYQKAQENQAIMNGTHESTGGVTPENGADGGTSGRPECAQRQPPTHSMIWQSQLFRQQNKR